MPSLAHDRYCDEIARQVAQLRAVVISGTDLGATVPTCPDWSLEDLVRHMGGALRWVDTLVRTRAEEEIPEERVPLHDCAGKRGDAGALDAWLAETGELAWPRCGRPARMPGCGAGGATPARDSGPAE